MKKFLIMLALFGLTEFALADRKEIMIVFGKEYEFNLDEYFQKPCQKNWSEIEKRLCNLNVNNINDVGKEEMDKIQAMSNECQNGSENECEKMKIILSKINTLIEKIPYYCIDGDIFACRQIGILIDKGYLFPKDARLSFAYFDHACFHNDAYSCYEASLIKRAQKEYDVADFLLESACEIDKKYCEN